QDAGRPGAGRCWLRHHYLLLTERSVSIVGLTECSVNAWVVSAAVGRSPRCLTRHGVSHRHGVSIAPGGGRPPRRCRLPRSRPVHVADLPAVPADRDLPRPAPARRKTKENPRSLAATAVTAGSPQQGAPRCSPQERRRWGPSLTPRDQNPSTGHHQPSV